MKAPTKIPEKGFYYHYKHSPEGSVNNYAYEFVGVGCHTEEDCRPEDATMVIYRPLYMSAFVYQAGKLFDLRPLDMWMGEVTVNGKRISRFTKITNSELIEKLQKIKTELYGEQNGEK
jgi:hypothetical protein